MNSLLPACAFHNKYLLSASKTLQRIFLLHDDRKRGKVASTYFQGQIGERKKREYFYYIDHQGMLFLDDAKMKNFTSCYKEKQFLRFFFNRLKGNDTGRYPEFPYVSPCGNQENNYVRCDDTPVVFTEILTQEGTDHLFSFNHAGHFLTMPFQPSKICMLPESGRIYHPAHQRVGGVGLISDKLSIQWTNQEHRFVFGDGDERPPTEFHWNDEKIKLTNELVSLLDHRNIN